MPNIDSLKRVIIRNDFIEVYEKDLLKNVLEKPTLLEQFILDREENYDFENTQNSTKFIFPDFENEDREIQLLNQHLSGKMSSTKDKGTNHLLL